MALRELGWINTLYPLFVPALFGAPFNIFLLRQYFMTIPLEMDDAARIDGCGWFAIFWRIIMPLSTPGARRGRDLLIDIPLERLLPAADLPEHADLFPRHSA